MAKAKFTILKMVQIPKEYLHTSILRQLDGREVYKDTDTDINDVVYDGTVFETIDCEQAEVPKLLKIPKEALKQVAELAKQMGKIDYIQVI